LYMDGEGLREANIPVSDLDFASLCDDGYLILCECKYQGYCMKGGQERLLTSIVDNNKVGGAVLEIWHNARVQDGAESVDVANCLVNRAYTQGKWYRFDEPLTVREAMLKIRNEHTDGGRR